MKSRLPFKEKELILIDSLELLQLELDAIINYSNDNILVADGKGIVLRSSPNCSEIYGIDTDYIIGNSVYKLQEENIFKPSVTVKVIESRKEVQVMQETVNGRVVMATGIPIFDDQGNLIRVISFSHDLTELKQLKDDYEFLQMKMKRFESEMEELREQETKVEGIVLKNKQIKDMFRLMNRIAETDATVVLLGESGVGKSMFARAIHNRSKRKNKPFIEINASAIPESIFEAEVFGYEAGAFTGASKDGKIGLIELADQGTLFFDEIAEIPLDLQVKLLKVLEEKKITRVGGTKSIEVDFRLIVATNRDLEKMVQEGKFRKDLYYRLNVVPLTIPPLRERKEDIYELAQYFLDTYNKKYGFEKVFHPQTLELFQKYDWPGNVRELENLVERLIVTTEGKVIHPEQLPMHNFLENMNDDASWNIEMFEENGLKLKEVIEEVEKKWLQRAYRQYKTTYEMAEALGISQATVVRKLKKYGINSK